VSFTAAPLELESAWAERKEAGENVFYQSVKGEDALFGNDVRHNKIHKRSPFLGIQDYYRL
jgi:hypothetical protein